MAEHCSGGYCIALLDNGGVVLAFVDGVPSNGPLPISWAFVAYDSGGVTRIACTETSDSTLDATSMLPPSTTFHLTGLTDLGTCAGGSDQLEALGTL